MSVVLPWAISNHGASVFFAPGNLQAIGERKLPCDQSAAALRVLSERCMALLEIMARRQLSARQHHERCMA
jgi:hypothetical protein